MSNASNTTANDILACARTLIIAGGYNGFSYADIAVAVGIRKASIHHHYPTKVDLVQKLVRQYREEALAGIVHLEREIPDPLEQLRFYIKYWETCIENATAPICVCALLASELPALPAEIGQEVRAHFQSLSAWLASILERGVQQGRVRLTGNMRAEAESIMATVHGAMISARAYGDPEIFGVVTAPLLERLGSPDA